MQFTVTAILKGQKVKFTWTDGKLSGDDIAVGYLAGLAHVYEGRSIFLGTQFPSTHTDHLKSPFSIQYFLDNYFDKVLDISGDPFADWYT